MSKKVSLGAAVAIAGVTAAVTVSLTYVYAMGSFNAKVADVNQRQAMYSKLSEIDQKARQDYIGKIDETKLSDGIAAGYISGLGDLQAKYMSAEKYKEYLSGTSGKNIGVGVKTLQDDDGNMQVIQVMPNSPAEKIGIKKGDTILSVDGKEIVRITYGDALNKLDGVAGTAVKLGILRTTPGENGAAAKTENIEVSVTRAEYTNQSISFSMINGNVGYIRISEFNNASVEQFNTALTLLVKQKAAGLIVDLRNNSGSEVSPMASILDTLLPAGNTVSYRNKAGETTVQFTSKANQVALPISVLINENTFGAAEIFAADIQEFKRGTLVGQKTPGYGTKDEVVPLSDGSAIAISVAHYLTPSGNVFDGKGITPEVVSNITQEEMNLFSRYQLEASKDPQVLAGISALLKQGAAIQQTPGTDAVPESSAAEASASNG